MNPGAQLPRSRKNRITGPKDDEDRCHRIQPGQSRILLIPVFFHPSFSAHGRSPWLAVHLSSPSR